MKRIFLSLIATAILISSCGTGSETTEVETTVDSTIVAEADTAIVESDSLGM